MLPQYVIIWFIQRLATVEKEMVHAIKFTVIQMPST